MKCRIGDICTQIVSGGTPKSTEQSYYENGTICWLNTKEVNFNRIKSTEKKITQLGFEKSSTKMIDINNVIIAMYGATAAKVAINKIPLCTNQACCNLKIDSSKADYNYVYYCLKNNYSKLFSLANGGAQQNLNSMIIKEFEIDLPTLDIQKKISRILLSLDNKIELNNEINNNLYDFLKSEFRSKYYSIDGEKIVLGELVENTIGGDWGKETPQGNNNTKVYCVRGADIPNMEYGNKGNAPERYILEKNYINKKLEANNIIVEISGGSPTQSTGRTAYITKNILNMYDSPLLCTNFCKAIKVKDEKIAPFVYMIFKLQYEDGIFFNWENGTTGIKNFALNDMMNNTEVALPSKEEIEKYYELFNTLMNKIAANSKQNQVLEQLRDTLLPKLMNGEIDLDNIEI